MAGNYPDAPSRRMAYDSDGTVGVAWKDDGTESPYEMSSGLMKLINDENIQNGFWNQTGFTIDDHGLGVYLLFPEGRELDGFYCARIDPPDATATAAASVTYSTDSTNGLDGIWASAGASKPHETGVNGYTDWRTDIISLAVSNAVGARLWFSLSFPNSYAMMGHLYGTISPGETPDRIIFLDTENSDAEFSKVLDYGEVPRGQTQVRTLKLKNNSATKTINTLQLTAEDLYLNAGGFYTFSLDDASYQATLNTIGNLGPSDTKLIYVKQSVPDAETLTLQTARLKIAHASLT